MGRSIPRRIKWQVTAFGHAIGIEPVQSTDGVHSVEIQQCGVTGVPILIPVGTQKTSPLSQLMVQVGQQLCVLGEFALGCVEPHSP